MFQREKIVRLFVCFPAPEEDVAADELVDDLALGRDALEDHVLPAAQLHHHVAGLPVHVPRLQSHFIL